MPKDFKINYSHVIISKLFFKKKKKVSQTTAYVLGPGRGKERVVVGREWVRTGPAAGFQGERIQQLSRE